MGLKEYHKKRDFQKTIEPKGKKILSSQEELQFVVQEHHASHLHYDFRLEVKGVLKSWAIPKGPSLDPSEKRLAVQVEDHPFEYHTFEGTIPKGNYGAGIVKIWDKGTYQAEGALNPQESELLIEAGLEKGHLNFVLNGNKLRGAFSLIRLQGSQSKQWLLIKKKDKSAQTSLEPSNKKLKVSSEKSSSNTKKKSKISSDIPILIKPMLATLVDKPFDDKNWIFEIKWDGYQALADIQKDQVNLYSRNFQSFNKRFPSLINDLRLIEESALLDGEIVVLDDQNKPSFQLLQNYPRAKKGTLIYYVFDLLYLKGEDIRHLPLLQRKLLLKKFLPNTPHLRFCEHIEEKGKAFFQAALNENFEGIIAKRSQSTYQEGRSHDWLKIKTHQRQEAIICGFTAPKGSREKFGSLVLGVYDQHNLVYVGQTGSGFDRQQLTTIHKLLIPLIQKKCPFPTHPKLPSSITWVKPELICEVKFAEWTKERQMRQAIFIGIREDKKAEEVVHEQTISATKALKKQASSFEPTDKVVKANKKTASNRSVKLTHLDKIYWPKEGYTKGDLIAYYQQIAPLILPYLKDRPEVLLRYPNGIDKSHFYQKEIDSVPTWIRTEEIQHEDHSVHYLFIEDEKSLLYTINLGCIDLNPFNSRFQSLYAPDYVILDLDPEEVTFEEVIQVAQGIETLLEQYNIPSVCKTSGSTGLHIYIPMGAQYTYEEAKQFAKLIAHLAHQQMPDLTSMERSPKKRQKKVYLDYLQNNFSQTVAAPYSVRPRSGALISTPLKWSEIKKGLNPTHFTLKTVMKRFEKVGDLFKPILGKGIDLFSILKKMDLKF